MEIHICQVMISELNARISVDYTRFYYCRIDTLIGLAHLSGIGSYTEKLICASTLMNVVYFTSQD